MTPTVVHALSVFGVAGVLALVLGGLGRSRAATAVHAALVVVAAALGLAAAGTVLATGQPWSEVLGELSIAGARLHLAVDPLAALFLLPIFVVGPLAAVYAHGYLADHRGGVGGHLALFSWLLGALTLVVVARDAFVFLFAWELITLLGFLLVAFDDRDPEVRRAAFLYVTISHVAAMCVLAFFLHLGARCGSSDLDAMAAAAGGLGGAERALLLLVALLGFGTKAGVAPLHVWLPRAHPAAPSHVSALLSAVVVKTALYALLRAAGLLGPTPGWWGYLLLGLGVVTGVGAILFAVAQRDLKRLLAYSTVENVGIILIGLGVGALGAAYGNGEVAVLGYAGALMHVLHHAAMKGLLFAAAGSFLHATHLRSLDRMGGLLRRMPRTGGTFVVGALAISAAPGLAGFAGEFLIYCGLARGALELPGVAGAGALAGLVALASIGGLAAAAFTKSAGAAVLGEPRTAEAAHAVESPAAMTLPLLLLAGLVLALGLVPTFVASFAAPVAAGLAGIAPEAATAPVRAATALLVPIAAAGALLLALIAALTLARARLLRARAVTAGPTWGCGYGAPSARMQYTGTSFSEPLVHAGRHALRPQVDYVAPEGYFPARTLRASEVGDPAERHLFVAGALRARARLLSLRWMQQGRLQLYLLYVLVAVVLLLTWDLVYGGLVQ